MILTTPTIVVERTRLQARSSSIDAATSALRAVTSIAESMIGTKLDRKLVTDYFSVKVSRFSSRSSLCFYPSRGFIDPKLPLSVRIGEKGERIQDFGTAKELGPEDYDIDYESGVLDIYDTLYNGNNNVAIQYTAGFTVGAGQVATGVPQWLEQAAISAAIASIQAHATPTQDTQYMGVQLRLIENQLSRVLNSHIRPRHNGIFESKTVEEEV